jgi:hypothetical protein
MGVLGPEFGLIGSIADGTRLGKASKADVTITYKGLEKTPFTVKDNATELLFKHTEDSAVCNYMKKFVTEKEIFDYPKFLEKQLKVLQECMLQCQLPDDLEIVSFRARCWEIKKHEILEKDSIHQPETHCLKCVQPMTHTKIGPCIVLRHKQSKEFLSINLVPLYPVGGKSSIDLMNIVIKTLVEKNPPFWLPYFESLMKRDVILPESFGDIIQAGVQWVAIKLLHYGPNHNYMMRPGQEMKIKTDFDEPPLNKRTYCQMKLLKDIYDVKVKSVFMKKVFLRHKFIYRRETGTADGYLLYEALSHPDLKSKFQVKIDLGMLRSFGSRLKKK